MKKIVVTGSNGLIGSEVVAYFDARGWQVHGVDNNMRRVFFGEKGDYPLESAAHRGTVPELPAS